ncbi:cytochrome c biogenesis protein ResB [Calditrichota bacterium]
MNKESNKKAGSMDKFLGDSWNLLKSMKFAVIILIVLAFASIFNLFAGEFIVEAQGSPERIRAVYESDYGSLRASLLMIFQMYKPYSSWWYTLLLGALTMSLTICVIERAPIVYKLVFKPRFISDPNTFKSFTHSKRIKGESFVVDDVSNLLKKRGYKIWVKEDSGNILIDGEKHAWSRSGAWFVHVGFILLVIGGLLIARGEYKVRAGGFPGDFLAENENEWGFNVRVDDFIVEFYPLGEGQYVEVDGLIIGKIFRKNPDGTFNIESFVPHNDTLLAVNAERIANRIDRRMSGSRIDQANISDYVATLTVIENNKEMMTREVEVNTPLRYKGYRFYQSSYDDTRSDRNGKWMTILEVRKDKGSTFVWAGIIVFSLGLLISMYITPRRIYLLCENAENKFVVYAAGKAEKNNSLFKNEFDKVVDEIRKRVKENRG